MRSLLLAPCLLAAVLFACSSATKGSGTTSTTSAGGSTGSASTTSATGGTGGSGGQPGDDAGSDGAAGDGAAGAADGGLPDPYGPVPEGGLFVQFVSSDENGAFDKSQENTATGTITFGAANTGASDGIVANLKRNGGEAQLSPSGAEEIVSRQAFSFGTFRYRFSLAACAASEEAVNGLFTYFNDGSKAADGLVVNREVDIEILCGEPYLVNLTIWTEYTDDSHLENQSRVVDTRTGTVYVFANDSEGNQTGTESHPELMMPGFPQAGAFYEMGFTWATDHLTYFMVNGGTTLTLWEATDATRIPQAPMEQHFNLWAPGQHWSTGASAPPPAGAATLALDWFRYDPG
jgi:hypothetical protein